MKYQAFALSSLMLLGSAAPVAAQEMPPPDDYDQKPWVETEAPPPPAFDLDRLIPIYVGPGSSLRYGLDPASLLVTQQDALVRYVIVARSSSGTVNILYEAIRCATSEIKTYARAGQDGQWRVQDDAQWREIGGRLSASYAQALVDGGMCIGKSVNGPADRMIDSLKRGGIPNQQS